MIYESSGDAQAADYLRRDKADMHKKIEELQAKVEDLEADRDSEERWANQYKEERDRAAATCVKLRAKKLAERVAFRSRVKKLIARSRRDAKKIQDLEQRVVGLSTTAHLAEVGREQMAKELAAQNSQRAEKAVCRRFRAKLDLPADRRHAEDPEKLDYFFRKGEILREVAAGHGTIRPENTPFGFTGIPLFLLEQKGVAEKYLEEIDPVPFEESEGYREILHGLVAEMEPLDKLLQEAKETFDGTGIGDALDEIYEAVQKLRTAAKLKG